MGFLKIILIILFLSINSYSQTKTNKYDKEIEKLNCKKKSSINLKKRLENYPFYQTSQIKFVSYKQKEEGKIGDDLRIYLDLLYAKKDSLIENKFDEIRILNLSQIEKLTNIIYNFGYKSTPKISEGLKCYMPRNAILFYDNENKLIGFIEVCFECKNYRTTDKRITLGEECTQKFDMLKEFFVECGIKFGTIEKE